MRKLFIFGIALVIGLLVVTSCVGPSFYGRTNPYGPGNSYGSGMMGRGMMGGNGMMGGGWGGYYPNGNSNAKPITIDQAADSVQRYLNAWGGKLVLVEVMNFAWNYYAEVEEKDTGIHAMELLVDKYTGQVSPEPGPNMMWNTKYSPMAGMMGGSYYNGKAPSDVMPVSPEKAKEYAQKYLDTNLTGLTVAEADNFYGYYTIHTLKDGQVEGMLSVNGYTGAIWYHSWHGPFIDVKEFE